jgi:hypothetical protein
MYNVSSIMHRKAQWLNVLIKNSLGITSLIGKITINLQLPTTVQLCLFANLITAKSVYYYLQ